MEKSPDSFSVLSSETMRAQLEHASKNPFLVSLVLKQWQRVVTRLSFFYAQLASLPRCKRRALQRALATSLIGAAMLLALSSAPVVRAATITVNSGTDALHSPGCASDGTTSPCSLRDAITFANANSGADTINLQVSTTLSSPLPQITTDVTIEGYNSFYVSGGSNYQVLSIGSGATVTINGMTIKEGNSGTNGGGIAVTGGSKLTLHNSVVTGSSTQGNGGGIYSKDSKVYVDNSTISYNNCPVASSGLGGGIFSYGTYAYLKVYNNSIIDHNDAFLGGGIDNMFGNTVIRQSSISHNTSFGGGGIYNAAAQLNVAHSFIQYNTLQSSGMGGGIANVGGEVYADQSSISHNGGAYHGGGISTDNGGSVTLHESTVMYNTASGTGGGIYSHRSTITMDHGDASHNYSGSGAGVTVIRSTAKITGATLERNYASTGEGGGILVGGSYLDLYSSSVRYNRAAGAGGGIYNGWSRAYIHDSIFSYNQAKNGGGIVNYSYEGRSYLLLENSAVYGNHATDSAGGIKNYREFAELRIKHSTINNNYAEGTYAGGIGSIGSISVRTDIEYSTISGNHAVSGGGVVILGGYLTLDHSNVLDNQATSYGGGITFSSAGRHITSSTIGNNYSENGPGGIFSDNSYWTMVNSTVSGNRSKNAAGGIANGGSFSGLFNATITGNTTTNGKGGGIANYVAGSYLYRNLIAGNSTTGTTNGAANELYDSDIIATRKTASNLMQHSQAVLAERAAKQEAQQKRAAQARATRRASAYRNLPQTATTDAPKQVRDTSDKTTKPARFTLAGPNAVTNTNLDHYNLIGHSGETTAEAMSPFVSPGAGDIVATSDGGKPTALASILNPALADNAGKQSGHDYAPYSPIYIQTHALVTGSPALDAAPSADCTAFPVNGVDERGVTRPQNKRCDIGAFELAGQTAVNVTDVSGRVNDKGNAVIRWKTMNESQIAGFNVYRKHGKGAWKQVNANFKQAKHPGVALGDKYRFADKTVQAGADKKHPTIYRYKVEVKYLDGHTEFTEIVRVRVH